jgi:hypothetical protein
VAARLADDPSRDVQRQPLRQGLSVPIEQTMTNSGRPVWRRLLRRPSAVEARAVAVRDGGAADGLAGGITGLLAGRNGVGTLGPAGTHTPLAAPQQKPTDSPERRRPPAARRRLWVDLTLLALLVLGALATDDLLGPARPYGLLIAALLVPGGALLTWLGVDDVLTAVGLAVGLSLAVEIVGSLALVWSTYWHPSSLALVLGVISAGLILWDLGRLRFAWGRDRKGVASLPERSPTVTDFSPASTRLRRIGRPLARLALLVPLVAGMAAWAVSLPHIKVRISDLGQYGLPPALPPLWYGALASLVLGATAALWGRRRPNGWVIAAYVLAVALVLYATVPAISGVPWYEWVYKHIGVINFIELHGHTKASVDIYNRWPGFFALSAAFSALSGLRNPVVYAGYAEPFFTIIAALLIGAIAKAVTRDARAAGAASLIFLVTDWVGQTYFSPQATAFVLALALILVVVRTMAKDPDERLMRLVRFVVRRPQLPALGPEKLEWSKRASAVVVLGIDFAIAATHQLTPYMLLIQLGTLVVLGMMRPRLLLLGTVVITLGYLLPNLGYIQRNYGLVTSLDPFNNAQHAQQYSIVPRPGKVFNAQMSQLLTYLLWLSSAAGAFVLARRGLGRTAALVCALAWTPFVLIFGSSYGGEALLRVIFFSCPGCAIVIGWATSTLRSRAVRLLMFGGLTAIMAALFVPAFFGVAEITLMPPSEVAASEYFYAHARPGTVLVLAGPDFPLRVSGNYDAFRGPKSDDDPNLLAATTLRNRPLGQADVPIAISIIHQYARNGYLVFSKSETEYASLFRLSPPGQLANLERAVARSPFFRLWHRTPDTRIYELINHPSELHGQVRLGRTG